MEDITQDTQSAELDTWGCHWKNMVMLDYWPHILGTLQEPELSQCSKDQDWPEHSANDFSKDNDKEDNYVL